MALWPLDQSNEWVKTVVGAEAAAGSVYAGGFAIDADGYLQIKIGATAATDVFIGGIRCTHDGLVYGQTSAASRHVGGVPIDGDGQVYFEAQGTVRNYSAGVPITTNGAVNCEATA